MHEKISEALKGGVCLAVAHTHTPVHAHTYTRTRQTSSSTLVHAGVRVRTYVLHHPTPFWATLNEG